MTKYVIETTQEFNVTYLVEADSPEAAWQQLIDPGSPVDCEYQSPGEITASFEDSYIVEDC